MTDETQPEVRSDDPLHRAYSKSTEMIVNRATHDALITALREIYDCSCERAEFPRGHLYVAEVARKALAKLAQEQSPQPSPKGE